MPLRAEYPDYGMPNALPYVESVTRPTSGAQLASGNGSPSGIELEICNDIAARQAKGLAKYGVTVENNPLDLKAWLQHAYEETLDQAIYLKRAMREMENDKVSHSRE